MNLTIQLSDEGAAALKQEAALRGLTLDEWVEALARKSSAANEAAEQLVTAGPISTRIRALWSAMPDDVRAQYPEGGANDIDRHVYGSPKR